MIKIDKNKCILCKICEKNCPFNAISIQDNKVIIGDNCTNCLNCVKKCPKHAIISKNKKSNDKKYDNYDVCIYGEKKNNSLIKAVYELLSEGSKLSKKLNSKLVLVVIGDLKSGDKKELESYDVDEVYLLKSESIEYDNIMYCQYLNEYVKTHTPYIFLFPASLMGRELAPYLGSMCNTGVTADCTKLEIDEQTKLLKQTRPTFGGKLFATINIPNSLPQICTIRPGTMDINKNKNLKKTIYIEENYINKFKKSMKKVVSDRLIDNIKKVDLKNADIIVAGGLGLGNKEGFELLKKLAKLLNGQVAATRACVENKWIGEEYQIGQTGITVSPKIYIACGISGAVQHMAGIKNCNYIIAINKDKNAPIFDVADYGIVEDLYEVIPDIISKLEEDNEK